MIQVQFFFARFPVANIHTTDTECHGATTRNIEQRKKKSIGNNQMCERTNPKKKEIRL